jgi:trehalose synthase
MVETSAPTAVHPLHDVNVGTKSLVDYRSTLVPGMYDEIVELGEALKGMRVAHLSATAFGGGVAEIMYTLMPLMRDVGVDAHWKVIHGAEEFFDVTKLLHNTLQGADDELTEEQREIWWKYQKINAEVFDASDFDVVVIHDPQPLGMRALYADNVAKWVWRCHIDLSTPNPDVIDFLLPEIERYDGSLFHRQEYVPAGLSTPPSIVPPAIDPLAPKNMALSDHDAKYIVHQFGIDVERPLITQVSRFDPWKDPLGVIDAYRIVKQQIPEVQLALVGSMAHDDPEGMEYWQKTVDHADDDPDIFILSNLNNVGAVEVNAFQVCSSVVLQKSIKEGFGLTVSEALWKGKPVVAGDVGGIRSQIVNGETGYLVNSVEECAKACLEIMSDSEGAHQMARAGKEHVREHFLTPRYLRDHLRLYKSVLGK